MQYIMRSTGGLSPRRRCTSWESRSRLLPTFCFTDTIFWYCYYVSSTSVCYI
uniref:Uncharacterized protein n=1 Tax=Arundo donax TaxID=35708 RepID=A0A0A9C413_ARUDO